MHVVVVREVQIERSSQVEKLARDKWDNRQGSVVTGELETPAKVSSAIPSFKDHGLSQPLQCELLRSFSHLDFSS